MILERILNEKSLLNLEEGDKYREFEGKRGTITVKHYEFHREVRRENGKSYGNILPMYECTLTIEPNDGKWWIAYWHGGNGWPKYLPWAYESAQSACEAMLVVSDALLN